MALDAHRMAVAAPVIAGTLAITSHLLDGTWPRPRIVVAALIVASMLSVAADVIPEIASGLAAIVLVTALTLTGPAVWARITALVGA